tara:strand:+ start:1240 stop:1506 length:267 start_codon:yes stop_codon:yes gene_type:complete
MPHHHLHEDILEEHQADIKKSFNRGKNVCTRCGNVIKGRHYVGTDATSIAGHTGEQGRREGSGETIKMCPYCYGKETGINFGQYHEEY